MGVLRPGIRFLHLDTWVRCGESVRFGMLCGESVAAAVDEGIEAVVQFVSLAY